MSKVVFSDSELKRFLEEFKDYLVESPNEYIAYFFKVNGSTVSIYKNGTVLFQGPNLEIFKEYTKEEITTYEYDNYNVIGADEVGTGDVFGPIVCASVYVSKDKVQRLKDLGIKDSKELKDDRIIYLAQIIIKEFPHQVSICRNEVYNDNINKINLNAMKAKLHNLNIKNLTNRVEYDMVVLDEFASEENYFSYLSDSAFKDIHFEYKGESKSIAVASSSIIARYYFLKELDRLNKEYNLTIPKGSGDIAQDLINKLRIEGKDDIFYHIAKLNFKNFKK